MEVHLSVFADAPRRIVAGSCCIQNRRNAAPEVDTHADGEEVGPERGDMVPMTPGPFCLKPIAI